ncbi:MAG: hypothetical protein K6T63_10805 [Alicyclobacillus herbarius]|uniref:hypothetical protein n=1 Tax=Alicyclobacillus herbarius TaxID=122960 RepID=UPI002352F30F|nr:hypothetical protein [Alicyclobacillus herbarius]MCL6633108.1 hypothetical protein [Alicyclobacillus herbarius]
MIMDDKEPFSKWLMEQKKIGKRSAKDVCSRVRRAARFYDLNSSESDDEIVFRVTQHPDFKMLSLNVRSQLKRAVRLYREYRRVTLNELPMPLHYDFRDYTAQK